MHSRRDPSVNLGALRESHRLIVETFVAALRRQAERCRVCPDPKCYKWFVGRKNKTYCSTRCQLRAKARARRARRRENETAATK